ncbi:MAG: PQQ-like beta-propeller repeat protein, partial [Candidatus Coatesbacteria bacterium]|nr:PQQ-like beta-propeller repeat protein [Candidatus Coatesbacteria bacterium]
CKRYSSAMLIVVLMALISTSVALCDSMMFRGGPQRTGVTTSPGLGSTVLEISWSYNVGTNNDWLCSTPAIDDASDLIIFGANDKRVYALSLAGALWWSYETGGQVYSSPLMMNGKVYVGSLDGKLYAFNYTGALEWTYQTGGAIYSSPLGYAPGGIDTIAFGSDDGKVYALGTDGQLRWSYQTGGWVSSSPAASTDGNLYACSYDGYLYKLDTAGTMLWRFDAGAHIFATPAIGEDGAIHFGTLDGTFFKILADGSEAFRFNADGPILASCSLDRDGYSRFGTVGNTFYRIDPTGEAASNYYISSTTPLYYVASPLLDSGWNSYVGTLDRTLYCFNATCSRTTWRYYMESSNLGVSGSGVYASPVLDGSQRLYVPCMNGKLYCFKAGYEKAQAGTAGSLYDDIVVGASVDAAGISDSAEKIVAVQPPKRNCMLPELHRGPEGTPTLLDEAMKMAGYCYPALAVDPFPVSEDPYRLSLVNYVLTEEPAQGPTVVRQLSDELDYECPTLQQKILKTASMADILVEPVSFSHEFGGSPLEEAIRAVYSRHGEALTLDQESKLEAINDTIGRDIQEAIGLLLLAMDEAMRLRDEAFAGLTATEREDIYYNVMDPNFIGNTSPLFSMFAVYDKIDRAKVVKGGAMVASVIDSLLGATRSGPGWEVAPGAYERTKSVSADGDVVFSFETPIGGIVLGGYGETTYRTSFSPVPEELPVLVVDLGGDDLYYNYIPSELRELLGAAVTIDVSGNDTYRTTRDNAQGSGHLGVGFCVDVYGDDYYQSGHFSQGAGWGGVGVLTDYYGNDEYYGETCCQGAGFMGVGLLIDGSGSDSYSVDEHGQAFGYISGAGVLLDKSGDDLYFAGGEYEHQYEPPRTTSMSQGYGFGVRLNYVGDPHASGGIGLLVDSAGDDTFISDFFGTAGAYWFGMGMLMNREGRDTYMSRQYSIASGIHLAVGLLVDDEGDDTYMCRSLSQGCAHDNSVGILVDNAGDDVYLAQDFSQGASSPRSFSVLADNAGNDMYWAMAGHLNQGEGRYDGDRKTSFSLLLDCGGRDFYQIMGEDNSRWTQTIYGVGIDSEYGTTGLH